MSLRSGRGGMLSRLSGAKLRAAGRKGNQSQRNTAAENKRYSDVVPF
jgi:hypothetical protein